MLCTGPILCTPCHPTTLFEIVPNRLGICRASSVMNNKSSLNSPCSLEQYLLLAKTAKGAAMVALIKQCVEAPGVHVFGELLEMPNVTELADGPNVNYVELLNLFAFGTYSDYLANVDKFPELTTPMGCKLRHLTIVSLAAKCKRIPYAVLLQELDLKNLRELEDLIIETIYSEIIQGKLDQKNQLLEVEYTIGRDIRQDAITDIVGVLQEWCDGCETMLNNVEEQIHRANKHKENCFKVKSQIETEVVNIKKAIKASSVAQEGDEADMGVDTREMEAQSMKPSKKPSKMKGLRGSGKFWTKSN
ncbi:COP9 signalosome complex subunit 7b [Strongylocentrotus purpuratus]|uniref:PCI domain-containing protein n=1 Tax=Strongylocentrotus purpuratus TaxID=7668 RepID=A0A7M7TGG5_STRPU|nr:COP9 signalosome complex subunit 7b [Strongylocentrotus purpuratus]